MDVSQAMHIYVYHPMVLTLVPIAAVPADFLDEKMS